MKRFTMTLDHLALLRCMNIQWEPEYLGAPAVDCKRPYGNGDVLRDVATIIGIGMEPNEDGEFPPDTAAHLLKLHKETKTALSVVLATSSFRAATYEADDYRDNWRQVIS